MKGTIYTLKPNANGHITFGFISDIDGELYFFHKSELKNCTISQLAEGDDVEFDTIPGRDGKNQAINIRKEVAGVIIENVNPGLNPKANLSYLSDNEKKIVNKLKSIFYVTHIGKEFYIGNSNYRYCLVKPTEFFRRVFHLSREIVVIFSDYVIFEPRGIDAFSYVCTEIKSKLRLERAMHILVSQDSEIVSKMKQHLKDNNLNQIVIPFSYAELLDNKTSEKDVQDRFKQWLFDIDLFADKNPVIADEFFFGRRDFVHDITDKCKNGMHSGIFGLRRSGKTSLLYAVKRLLDSEEYCVSYIACPTLSTADWRVALYNVAKGVYNILNIDMQHDIDDYENESITATCFEEDMHKAIDSCSKPIILMFDEIEAITFSSNVNDDNNIWSSGEYYLNFWKIIKGFYSKYPGKVSILIAGTNPMINEISTVCGQDNPMFETLAKANQGTYLQPFDFESIRTMVNSLGGYMGMNFPKETVARLNDDCGGHPYLIKMACSSINHYLKLNKMERPANITKSIYEKAIPEFEKSSEAVSFFVMILNILIKNYQTEFNTLKILATDGDKLISQTKTEAELHHLLGYGLIEHNQGNYAIKFNTVKNYLIGEYKFERQGLSIEEQKDEISLRLGNAEMALRKIIKSTLQTNYGKTKAKDAVIKAMRTHKSISNSDIERAEKLEYAKLFDTSCNKMYLSLLSMIIIQNISAFEYVFEDQEPSYIESQMAILNESRRCPFHAYDEGAENWNIDKFNSFRQAMTWLESYLSDFD